MSCDTTTIMDMANKKHIEEEFADVCVVLEQFRHYYGISDKEIKKVMKYKINRQLERMEENER